MWRPGVSSEVPVLQGASSVNRLSFALAATCLVASVTTTPLQAAAARIHSQAELERYLRDMPIEATPLAPLPPAARRRFLASLAFGREGARIQDLGEPDAELTHPQVVRLFALFGQQDIAESLRIGLTPAQKAHRDRERDEDARHRGCARERCPESKIERLYDQLSATRPDVALPDARRFAAEKQEYDRLFARFQHPGRLRTLSAPDLRLLARALKQALYAMPDAGHVAQLHDDLAEMQRRGMTEDEDFTDLYLAEVGVRQFEQAAVLRRQHPGMDVPALPTFVSDHPLPSGLPTALSVDGQSRTMRRRAVVLDGPLKIVVIAGCHFSETAARAIEGDAPLRALFARDSLWLASPSQPIEDVVDWNRKFGDLPMLVAWRQEEWSMLPDWHMPTYYVFRNGRLVDRFSGWRGIDELRKSLHQAGAL